MHNDIEPRVNRSLDPRSSERIVANRNQFPFARDLRNRVKIDQLEQRITRGLDPNHARVWFDCALQIFRVGQIDVGKIKIRRASPNAVEQSKGAAVKIVTGDDMRAAVEQLEHRRHRRQAGCKGEPARPAFQIRNAPLVGKPRWID